MTEKVFYIKRLFLCRQRNVLFVFMLYAFCSSLSTVTQAQDIHFSQFMYSPLNLNPAQTGNFRGAYRFVANARRQWSSVTLPYQTYGLSADARDFKRVKNLGAGMSMYYDQTGDSHFSTLQINFASSYRFYLDRRGSQTLTLGVQGGFTQRRIDYSNLSWDNQYNGFFYDPNVPSIETFANAGRIYPNLNAGLNWTKYYNKREFISSGIALFNITKPKQSFFNDDKIRLDRRMSFNINGQYQLNDKYDLLPAGLFMLQGAFKEIIIGTSLKYTLQDTKRLYRAIYGGVWLRTRDAGYVSIGMDYDEWFFGLSYDFNLSNLVPASRGRGGVELSVIYIVPSYLPKRLKYKVCPDFM